MNNAIIETESKHNFRIRGRKSGQRGGTFFGVVPETGLPEFGGINLIHAPVWWNRTKKEMEEICRRCTNSFPGYEFYPHQLN